MLNYKGIYPTKIDPSKLKQYVELKGRALKNSDIDVYVRNYAIEQEQNIDQMQINPEILSDIIDNALELEIFFRS